MVSLKEIKKCQVSIKIGSLTDLGDVIERVVSSYSFIKKGEKPTFKTMFFTSFKFEDSNEKFKSPKLSLKGNLTVSDDFGNDLIEFLDCCPYLKYVVSPGSNPKGLDWFNKNIKSKVDKFFTPTKLIYDYNENVVPGFIRTSMEFVNEDEWNEMLNLKFPYFLYNLSKEGLLKLNPTILSITLADWKDINISIEERSVDKTSSRDHVIRIKLEESHFDSIRERSGEEGDKSIYDLIEKITGIDELTLLSLEADEEAFITIKELD
jgi:hypothetical protein